MENYKILISSSAEKSLKKIPKKDLSRIVLTISHLSNDPFPVGSRKLTGEDNVYRIRQGQYRVIYEVYKDKILVIVLKIGHRKDVYKKN